MESPASLLQRYDIFRRKANSVKKTRFEIFLRLCAWRHQGGLYKLTVNKVTFEKNRVYLHVEIFFIEKSITKNIITKNAKQSQEKLLCAL